MLLWVPEAVAGNRDTETQERDEVQQQNGCNDWSWRVPENVGVTPSKMTNMAHLVVILDISNSESLSNSDTVTDTADVLWMKPQNSIP